MIKLEILNYITLGSNNNFRPKKKFENSKVSGLAPPSMTTFNTVSKTTYRDFIKHP